MTDRNGPIFIGGTDRAGKTLMSAILASHPRIAIPAVGSNLWTLFYRRFGDLARPANLERCLSALLEYSHVRHLKPEIDRLREDFKAGPATYPRLFALLMGQYAARLGKPRWGDQTGLVEAYADDLFAAYPDARLIHMVRDPRDRYEASLLLWPGGRLRVGGAVARWLFSVRLARRNLALHASRYLVVRYEDLVTDPTACVRAVCAFIGEAFHAEMLELRGMPTYRARLIAESDAEGASRDPAPTIISARYIGVHDGRLPATELAFLTGRAAAEMRQFGYAVEPVRLSPSERLRYLTADLPLNLARMWLWQGRTLLGRWLPQLAGRRPSIRYRVGHAG
jgi:Sulfotransferase family